MLTVTASVKHWWISNPRCPRYWVQDNFTAPSCSDTRLGYLWSVMCITAYQQQGNCLSAQPLGVLSLVWLNLSSSQHIWCPFYDPYITPLCHMLLLFISTVLLKTVYSIMLCWLHNLSIVLCHKTFSPTTKPLFLLCFIPTLPFFFFECWFIVQRTSKPMLHFTYVS